VIKLFYQPFSVSINANIMSKEERSLLRTIGMVRMVGHILRGDSQLRLIIEGRIVGKRVYPVDPEAR